jgi:hypothetical protein
MLDYRAWIVASVILLSAAGAYVLWIYRPKATYTARSLSAAPPHAESAAKPATKSLHVEGCNDDFIVSPGELVEPTVVPGASLDQFRSAYGQESDAKDPGVFTWKTEEYDLRATRPSSASPDSLIQISLNGAHVVETLDGIELGLDSFGTIFRKMSDRKVEIHERIRHTPGHWILTLTMYSSCSRRFRGEYTRSLPDDPETSRLINRRVTGGNGQIGLIRSDIFMNKVVYDYTLQPSNGSDDDPTAGEPSEHE